MREGGGDRQEESSDQLTATATAATRPHIEPFRTGKTPAEEGRKKGGRALGKPLSPTLLTVRREEDRERGDIISSQTPKKHYKPSRRR